MGDLKSELLGEQAGVTYSLVLPPGWARFAVDAEAERLLMQNVTAVLRERGQVSEVLRERQRMTRLFSELRRRRAKAIYLPVVPVEDVVIPASIVVLPAPVAGAANLAKLRERLDRDQVVAATEVDGRQVWRWEESQRSIDGDSAAGSITINYLFEAPAGNRPAVVSCTLLVARGYEDGTFAESVLALLDAIAATFSWIPASEAKA